MRAGTVAPCGWLAPGVAPFRTQHAGAHPLRRPSWPAPSSATSRPRFKMSPNRVMSEKLEAGWLLPPLRLADEDASDAAAGPSSDPFLDSVSGLLQDLRGLDSQLESSASSLREHQLESLTDSDLARLQKLVRAGAHAMQHRCQALERALSGDPFSRTKRSTVSTTKRDQGPKRFHKVVARSARGALRVSSQGARTNSEEEEEESAIEMPYGLASHSARTCSAIDVASAGAGVGGLRGPRRQARLADNQRTLPRAVDVEPGSNLRQAILAAHLRRQNDEDVKGTAMLRGALAQLMGGTEDATRLASATDGDRSGSSSIAEEQKCNNGSASASKPTLSQLQSSCQDTKQRNGEGVVLPAKGNASVQQSALSDNGLGMLGSALRTFTDFTHSAFRRKNGISEVCRPLVPREEAEKKGDAATVTTTSSSVSKKNKPSNKKKTLVPDTSNNKASTNLPQPVQLLAGHSTIKELWDMIFALKDDRLLTAKEEIALGELAQDRRALLEVYKRHISQPAGLDIKRYRTKKNMFTTDPPQPQTEDTPPSVDDVEIFLAELVDGRVHPRLEARRRPYEGAAQRSVAIRDAYLSSSSDACRPVQVDMASEEHHDVEVHNNDVVRYLDTKTTTSDNEYYYFSHSYGVRWTGEWSAMVGLSLYELWARLQLGRAAIDAMVFSNIRLVFSWAGQYTGRLLTFESLVSDGLAGLRRGAERYDPRRGVRLGTYASWWVRQALSQAALDRGRLTPVSAGAAALVRKANATELEMRKELRREPTEAEVLQRLGVTAKRLKFARKEWRGARRLIMDEEYDAQGRKSPLLRMFSDEPDPMHNTMVALGRKRLESAIDRLPSRERSVLRSRWGIEDGRPQTLTQCAEAQGVTKERIRQIEVRAVKRLTQLTLEQDGAVVLDDAW